MARKKVTFALIGGFLGAGKTTTLCEVAKQLAASGKRVGVITNDQAPTWSIPGWRSWRVCP
jgi:signal recognition particle GTPase